MYDDLDIEFFDKTITVTVEYKMIGEHVAATHDEPAEAPEMWIDFIGRHGYECNIVNSFSSEELGRIKEMVQEKIDNDIYRNGVQ